jgi:hypothetical protein
VAVGNRLNAASRASSCSNLQILLSSHLHGLMMVLLLGVPTLPTPIGPVEYWDASRIFSGPATGPNNTLCSFKHPNSTIYYIWLSVCPRYAGRLLAAPGHCAPAVFAVRQRVKEG